MSVQILRTRVLIKNDYSSEWKKIENSFLPLKGEIIVYLIEEKDSVYSMMKIGDGITLLKDLSFVETEAISLEKINQICSSV